MRSASLIQLLKPKIKELIEINRKNERETLKSTEIDRNWTNQAVGKGITWEFELERIDLEQLAGTHFEIDGSIDGQREGERDLNENFLIFIFFILILGAKEIGKVEVGTE